MLRPTLLALGAGTGRVRGNLADRIVHLAGKRTDDNDGQRDGLRGLGHIVSCRSCWLGAAPLLETRMQGGTERSASRTRSWRLRAADEQLLHIWRLHI